MSNLDIRMSKLDIRVSRLDIRVSVPTILVLTNVFEPSSNDVTYIAEMKSLMLEDIKERMKKNLNFPIMIKCTVLDPRFKDLKMIETQKELNL